MTEVWVRAGLPYRPKGRDSLARLRKQISETPDLFLGAFENGRLVGVAICSDDLRKGWINRLAVVPDARGRGIGRALIEASEDALGRRGHKLFCVLIEEDNPTSTMLFSKAGYRHESDILYYAKRESESY